MPFVIGKEPGRQTSGIFPDARVINRSAGICDVVRKWDFDPSDFVTSYGAGGIHVRLRNPADNTEREDHFDVEDGTTWSSVNNAMVPVPKVLVHSGMWETKQYGRTFRLPLTSDNGPSQWYSDVKTVTLSDTATTPQYVLLKHDSVSAPTAMTAEVSNVLPDASVANGSHWMTWPLARLTLANNGITGIEQMWRHDIKSGYTKGEESFLVEPQLDANGMPTPMIAYHGGRFKRVLNGIPFEFGMPSGNDYSSLYYMNASNGWLVATVDNSWAPANVSLAVENSYPLSDSNHPDEKIPIARIEVDNTGNVSAIYQVLDQDYRDYWAKPDGKSLCPATTGFPGFPQFRWQMKDFDVAANVQQAANTDDLVPFKNANGQLGWTLVSNLAANSCDTWDYIVANCGNFCSDIENCVMTFVCNIFDEAVANCNFCDAVEACNIHHTYLSFTPSTHGQGGQNKDHDHRHPQSGGADTNADKGGWWATAIGRGNADGNYGAASRAIDLDKSWLHDNSAGIRVKWADGVLLGASNVDKLYWANAATVEINSAVHFDVLSSLAAVNSAAHTNAALRVTGGAEVGGSMMANAVYIESAGTYNQWDKSVLHVNTTGLVHIHAENVCNIYSNTNSILLSANIDVGVEAAGNVHVYSGDTIQIGYNDTTDNVVVWAQDLISLNTCDLNVACNCNVYVDGHRAVDNETLANAVNANYMVRHGWITYD